MKKAGIVRVICMLAVGLGMVIPGIGLAEEGGVSAHPWSISVGCGVKDFEGDEAVRDTGFGTVSLSYDWSARWRFEGTVTYFPQFLGNMRRDWETGIYINRLEERSGVTETSGMGLSIECMYHLNRLRVDPYIVVGAGMILYEHDVGEGRLDPTLNAGVGVMYHFNHEWAVRADGRAFIAGSGAFEANSMINVGLVYTIGGRIPPGFDIGGGVKDTDGDGLTDDEERSYGTDIHRPDTDGDGLTDYEEVKTYHTDPLKEDTDLDMLKDGEEVLTYKTNPIEPDTDNGGVADGHEVLEDSTDPLDPADDLRLFTLNIEFDYNQAIIKPKYFPQLDAIGKVLTRHGKSTAKIEGHADKRRKSEASYNQRLSKRRANSVMKYLQTKCRIGASRMTAKGFGFSRKVAPNDPVHGNPRNRRVDIYIQGAREAGDPVKRTQVVPPSDDAIVK